MSADNTQQQADQVAVQEEVSQVQETAPADDFGFDDLNIDELISQHFDYEELQDPARSFKGVDYNKALSYVHPEGRKIIQNLRASYTRKTQELANIRAELEAQREEMLTQNRLLADSDFARSVRAKAEDQTEYDLWDTDGQRKEIEREVARRIDEAFRPMQEKLAQETRRQQLESFKREHPEFATPEYRSAIADHLAANPGMKLEDAFFVVKGKKASEEIERLKQEKQQAKQVQRDVLTKTSNGRKVSASSLPEGFNKLSAYEKFLYFKSQQK